MPLLRHEVTIPEQALSLGHDQLTPAHQHEQGHLVYPATGALSMVTDAGSWIAPPNRAVWIPGKHLHQHRAHGSTDMRVVFMRGDHALRLATHPAVLAVTPLARQAFLALTDGSRRPAASLDRLRHVVIDELTAAPEQPLHLPVPRDARLIEVTRLVSENLADALTLRAIGHRIGASERTLSRVFHDETGMTFRQWRTQLRVHAALRMLTDGVSVLSAAHACGWANPSAFIEAFTALVGVTPGTYQRSLSAT